MSMLGWAKREVNLAKEIEKQDLEDGEFDYGGACYDSALKAFESLMEDEHSGCSMEITRDILDRLMDGKPLTPIEDTDDIWYEVFHDEKKGFKGYQCKRMSSLFKYVYDTGELKYNDICSFYCMDIDTGNTYYFSLVQDIVDELFPILMPYTPSDSIQIGCMDFVTDTENGDFDTFGIIYALKPDGRKIDIYRYFKEGNDNEWIEIDLDEYSVRLARSLEGGDIHG